MATNYFVAPTGNDANSGLDLAHAWLTGGRANSTIVPGDTVNVADGTFAGFNITVSGTDAQRITFKSINLRGAKIVGQGNAGGITILADYLTLQGFDDSTQGTGPGIDGANGAHLHPHHITLLDMYIHDCGGGGVNAAGGDYWTILRPEITRCALTNPFQESGISFYQFIAVDNNPGDHNLIADGIIHHCYNAVNSPATPGANPYVTTDGEGVIIDDFNKTQPSPWNDGIPYLFITRIKNMLIADNGGRGVECGGGGSQFVIVEYCTFYKNNWDTHNAGTWRGEINFAFSSNCIARGNIPVCDSSINPNNTSLSDVSTFPTSGNVFDSNITFDTNNPGAQSFRQENSTATIINPYYHTDPKFVSPNIDPTIGNFRLQATSPAILAGTIPHPVDDILGLLRPASFPADLGCYRFSLPLNFTGVAGIGVASPLTPTVVAGVVPHLIGVAGAGAANRLTVPGSIAATGVFGSGRAASLALALARVMASASGTGLVNALVAQDSLALIGIHGSGQAGILTVTATTGSVAVNIPGVFASGAGGAFAAEIDVALAGVSGSGHVAALGNPVGPGLGGVAGSGVARAFIANLLRSLTAIVATGAAGTLIQPINDPLIAILGSGVAGAFSASESIALVGVAGSGQIGVFTVTRTSGNVLFNLLGVAGSGQASRMVQEIDAVLAGVSGVGQANTLLRSPGALLPGVAGLGAAGAFARSINAILAAVFGNGAAGTLRLPSGLSLIGVAGAGLAGSNVDNLLVPLSGVTGAGAVQSFFGHPSVLGAVYANGYANGFLSTVPTATRGDIIAVTIGFNSSLVGVASPFPGPIFDPARAYQYGADFLFNVGIDLTGFMLLRLIFTNPNGNQFVANNPPVYVGTSDIPTPLGTFAAKTFVVYRFQPFVLIRGNWTVQLLFLSADNYMLSNTGKFAV